MIRRPLPTEAEKAQFLNAAKTGDFRQVKSLLKRFSDPELLAAADAQGDNVLHCAALSGSSEIAEFLIRDKHINVNPRNRENSTPLHLAARSDRPDVAEVLISNGALVNARDARGRTPLFLAEEGGHSDVQTVLEERHGSADPPPDGVAIGKAAIGINDSERTLLANSCLSAGTKLDVLAALGTRAYVRTGGGKHGWIERRYLCTLSEYTRRTKSGELPIGIVCMGADGERLFMYDSSIEIQNNRPVLRTGHAVWMNESARGKLLTLNQTEVYGDPEVLVFITRNGRVTTLPVWNSTTKG